MAVHSFPNEDRIPLRDLPEEEYVNVMLALRECSERVEWTYGPSYMWSPCAPSQIRIDLPHRILPLVKEAVIPWEHIAAEFRWYAEDKEHTGCLFKDKPYWDIDDEEWKGGSQISPRMFTAFRPSEGIAPEDSLRERPAFECPNCVSEYKCNGPHKERPDGK